MTDDSIGMSATYIKDLEGFTGRAALYRVNPPVEWHDWATEEPRTANFVVVSAASVMFSGPETYLFPADEKGNIVNWTELEGSYRGGLNHTQALRNAGYSV